MVLRDEVILIVDDDPLQLLIISDALESFGFMKILKAQSGCEAMGILKNDPTITMLLMDIVMPGMDGPQFLRHLAEIQYTARIVLISSVKIDILRSIDTLGRSHGLNVLGYIHKPVTREALNTLLTKIGDTTGQRTQQKVPKVAPDYDAAQLIEAMRLRAIHPWYQPKVDIDQMHLIGVEALARWKRSDGRMESPVRFVPVIERLGLWDELFFCMLEQVLADMQCWRRAGKAFKASINLTMDCAFQLDLPERIEAVLHKYDIPASEVVIEVTESRLMVDQANALETLTRLSLMGLTLSIDDFGTGYSGLSQVANLPFSEIKLDRSFVQRAADSKKSYAILQSAVTLGRSLGMDVVAEGIETHEQLDILRGLGASVMQGYLAARPMPERQLMDWLAGWRPGTKDRKGCDREFTLLVVDDNRSMRRYVEVNLKERMPEIRVITAANGEEALGMAKEHPVDAATLDFHMPGIDGIELLQRMRNLCPAARYALLTSNMEEQIALMASRLGALYCPKPLTTAQFDRIARHLAP
jgi:EAL domain-containing protein (putative c-di-GMP-specific phosphodiesterase class I)/DNA-binding NarL/FixJ family response regulator